MQWGADEILLDDIIGIKMRICHIPVLSSELLSVTGTSSHFPAAQQSWQCPDCVRFLCLFLLERSERCLHLSRGLFNVLRCVSECKNKLIKRTGSLACVQLTVLFPLTKAGGVSYLTRIKQMLLCPSCWRWNVIFQLDTTCSVITALFSGFSFW